MPPSTLPSWVIRFAKFEVDLHAGELRKNGRRIRLQDQPFQVLAMLLEHPGEIVTREEIRQKLWLADTFVDFDHGLNSAVGRLRDALNDSASTPRFIETVPRRGYRFIAQLGVESPAAEEPITTEFRYSRATVAVATAGFALLLGLGIWWRLPKRAESSLSTIEVAPLAGLPGYEGGAAFSPDGHQVAFHVMNGRDNSGIFVALVGGEK